MKPFIIQELKWDSSLTRSRNAADGKPTSNVAKRRFAPQSTPRPRRNNVSTGRRQRQNTRETSVSRVFSYILPLPEYEKTAESVSAPSAVSVSASYYRSSAIWTRSARRPSTPDHPTRKCRGRACRCARCPAGCVRRGHRTSRSRQAASDSACRPGRPRAARPEPPR